LPAGSIAWGDYDKDGDLDVLISGGGLLRVYRNNGNGTFTDIGANLRGVYGSSVAWGDFNNDGNLDFVVVGSTNNTISGVVTRFYVSATNLAGAGLTFSNNVSAAAAGVAAVWKGTAVWGDYDNDGDLDLLITGETTNGFPLTRLYRNDGGIFYESGWSMPGLKNSFAAWGDYDHDGNLDLALSGYGTNGAPVARILRNYGPPALTNLPPSFASGLGSIVTGKSVRLNWSRANDANHVNALTYNVRIGTAPGLGNVLSPMAAPDGTRRIAALGNTQYRLASSLTNLIAGTYYWSVQAVDHSFAGSAFATEQTFTISNRPPIVTDRWLTCAEDTSLDISLTSTDPDNDPLSLRVVTLPLFGSLSGTPPNVTYRPATNYFGYDQFRFVANDRSADSAPATVFITVTPVRDLPAPLLSLQSLPASEMRLALQAEPWRTWEIQVSEDLVHWQVWTSFLATNILMDLIDHDAPLYPQRFYRAAATANEPLLGDPRQIGDTFQFLVEGEQGRNYRLLVSTNLSTWVPLQHLLMTNYIVPWTDPTPGNSGVRLYRIQALP
jgi:hypothetical protein